MAEITVTATDEGGYRVDVVEGLTRTTHLVTIDPPAVERLGRGVGAETLVAASFRFLLDREPKESILSRFDLSVISRYFPEYETEIGGYLP